jgi:ABC-type Na+ efflux pump permease subunit
MNYSIIKLLILKDWYLNRWMIIGSIPAGLISVGIMLTGSNAAFFFGMILLVMVIIVAGAQLSMATTITERKEQTLAFVMSLPISFREYTAAKILGNLIIFLIPWLPLSAACFVIAAFVPGVPHGLAAYVALMAMEMLVSTCLISATALTTESQGWAIGAIMVGNLAFNAFGYFFAHIPSIAASMWGPRMLWPPAAIIALLSEFAAIALLLSGTFFIQSRKRDFL